MPGNLKHTLEAAFQRIAEYADQPVDVVKAAYDAALDTLVGSDQEPGRIFEIEGTKYAISNPWAEIYWLYTSENGGRLHLLPMLSNKN